MTYKIITEPTSEPLVLSETLNYLKLKDDFTDDNALITNMIKAARMEVEKYTNRQLMPATYEMYFDRFYNEMILSGSPVKSISNVKYYDTSNVLQTLNSAIYDEDLITEPSRLTLSENKVFPSTKLRTNAVKITYVSGYVDADSVPESIKIAMLMIIGNLYENRQDVSTFNLHVLPFGSRYLLDNYRVNCF